MAKNVCQTNHNIAGIILKSFPVIIGISKGITLRLRFSESIYRSTFQTQISPDEDILPKCRNVRLLM